jgi:hypothetical protein
MEKTVFCELTMPWLRATRPTNRSWFLLIATTEGTSRSPSEEEITTGSLPCMTAPTELVVPRSIPMIFDINDFSKKIFLAFFYVLLFSFVCLRGRLSLGALLRDRD